MKIQYLFNKKSFPTFILAFFGTFLNLFLLTDSWAMDEHNIDTKSPATLVSSLATREDAISETPLLKIGDRLLNKEESDRIYKCIDEAGYNGAQFNFTKFSKWYWGKFIEFDKQNLGFDESGKPLAYALDYNLNFSYFLPLIKRHFFYVPTVGLPHYNLQWEERLLPNAIEEMLKELPNALEQVGKVLHITGNEKLRELLTMNEQRIYLSNGELANFSKDTKYSMNKKGKLFIKGQNCTTGCFHSDLLKGKSAWCAGEIGAENGKICFLSNCSGHYLPSLYHLYTFAEFLKDGGYFSDNAIIRAQFNANSKLELGAQSFFMCFQREALRLAWVEEAKQRINSKPFFKNILHGLLEN